MGILEIALLIGAVIAGLGLGAVGAVVAVENLLKQKVPTPESQFQVPRANFGDAIPFIFGTCDQPAPLLIYAGPVKRGDPYNQANPTNTDKVLVQYRCTLDLVLCERMVKDDATLGEIYLRRIWYGDAFLWDLPSNLPPVKTSGYLIDKDPGGYAMPGSVTSQFERGGGWWHGGCMGDKPVNPGGYVPYASGPCLGDYDIIDSEGNKFPFDDVSPPFVKGLGMERVCFYSGQSGEEVENPQIRAEKLLSVEEHYPTYPKLARLVFEDFIWGPESRVQNITAQLTVSCPAPEIGDVTGLMWNGLDVNPISVLFQVFSCADFAFSDKVPACNIASFTAARAAIETIQWGMSYKLEQSMTADDFVKLLLKHVDGFLYRDPLTGEVSIALNLPAAEAPAVFDESHILSIQDISKTTWAAAISQVRLNFTHRDLAPNDQDARNVAVAKDPGLSASQGSTENLDETIPTVRDPNVANEMAQKRLSMANTPLLKVDCSMNRLAALEGDICASDLRPGMVIAWSYAPYELPQRRFRIMKVNLGSLDSNAVRVTMVEDRYTAPNFVQPPGETDTDGPPPLEEVTVSTYEVITAPYYMARRGLGADARFALTSAPLYRVNSDEDGLQFAVNYDRFLVLAKRPYASARTFAWSLFKTGGAFLEGREMPYTEAGELVIGISSLSGDDDGIVPSVQLTGLDPSGVTVLRNSRCFLLIEEEWFYTDPANVTLVNETSVTITDVWRGMLDSPQLTSHSLGTRVWVIQDGEDWARARLSAPYESSREEYFDFYTAGLTTDDGHFNEFQTLTLECYSTIANIDSSRRNVSTQTAAQFLDNRANRCLPIRKPEYATASAFADSAALTFSYDFEQLTSIPNLYQQRELAEYDEFGGPAFSLILPPYQTAATDPASVERFDGVLSEEFEDEDRHVAKLEVWYEYLTGPLAGTLRRCNVVGDAGSGSALFAASAESTTRSVRCYIRTVFAPHVLGDAGRVPIRHSRPRTFTILLVRT